MSDHSSDQPDTPRRSRTGPTEPRMVQRYKVVLLSDPKLDLMHIVRSLMLLTRFPREEATFKMWEAQHHGRCVILFTYLERAELYVEQFAERGMRVAVEPA
jgi:ATP-dependent Clp protease adapter protein ClpS